MRPYSLWGEYAFLDNLDVPGRPLKWFYVAGLLLCGFFAYLFYIPYRGQTDPNVFLPQVVLLFLVLFIWIVRKFLVVQPVNILSPDVLFVSLFSVFHFSYIVFYALRLADWDDEIFWAPETVLKAVLFCLWCLLFFLMGYEAAGSKFRIQSFSSELRPCPLFCLKAGKMFVFFAVFFFWGTLFSAGFSRLISDYKLLIRVGELTAWGRFFWLAHDLGIIGLVIYCTASSLLYHKTMSGVLFTVLTWFYIAGLLLLGDRGGFIQAAIIPIVTFHYFHRKIKSHWVAGIVLILFFVMAVIGITRNVAVLDVKRIAQEFQSVKETEKINPITRTLLEFGASIKTVGIAMKLVPEQYSYRYGLSYLQNLHLLIPNIIPGFIRTQEESIGAWLTEAAFGSLASTHGRGGSIAMEAYLNFGFIGGIVFFGFLGYIYRILYERILSRPTFLRIALFLGFTAGLTLWIRNTANTFYRPFVWTFLIAWIVYWLSNGRAYESPLSVVEEVQSCYTEDQNSLMVEGRI